MLLVSHSASVIQQKAFGSGLARVEFMEKKGEKQAKQNKSVNLLSTKMTLILICVSCSCRI